MNNEIKEILDKLKKYSSECHTQLSYVINGYKRKHPRDLHLCMYDVDKLLDYITNLQEENERLKQWDCNKDTRNSRQRVANAKLMKKNEILETNYKTLQEDITTVAREMGFNGEFIVSEDLFDWVRSIKEENSKLKAIIEEYERLNKEKGRGFKITNVETYNINELLNYKSRNEKAIEYINRKKYQPSPLGFELELSPKELYQLLNILGGDKE